GEAAFCGRQLRGVGSVDDDVASCHVLEAGNEAEQSGFAATGGPDEDDELAILDGQICVGDDGDVAKALLDVFQDDSAHYFTAPKVRPRTSCFWANQPITNMGAIAMVEAAESFAQNRPSGLE